MKFKKRHIFLIAIIILAGFLRLWQLDQYPSGLNADEASYGYNAYSLIETGKDEHGISWPVHLKSFADYKPAGTAYILIPFVKVFGLTVEAIRLPSAILGSLSILLIYLLVSLLFKNNTLGLISGLFLAISPWHIQFSRGAWETNIATTFMLLGTYLFFVGLRKSKYLIFSALSFSASMYTYHSPRVIIPLLVIFLTLLYRKELLKIRKGVSLAAVVGFIVLIPLAMSYFGPAGSARFSGVSIFSDPGSVWKVNQFRGEHNNYKSITAKILHSRYVSYGEEFVKNYLSHFNGNFLFVSGDDNRRSNIADMGEMYLFDALLLPLGILFLIRKKPQNWQVPLAWLIIAPLPASLTFQAPNALRSNNMVIPLIIMSAFGFYYLAKFIREKLSKKLSVIVFFSMTVIVLWNLSYYLHSYYVHYSKTNPEAWEYGIKDLVNYLEPIKNDYSKIYVTEQYDQPYIIFLFYLKYPPKKFQSEVVLTPRDKFYFSTVRDFDNYHFENINWETFSAFPNSLVCGTDKEIPNNANIIKIIMSLNGKPAFKCAKT